MWTNVVHNIEHIFYNDIRLLEWFYFNGINKNGKSITRNTIILVKTV